MPFTDELAEDFGKRTDILYLNPGTARKYFEDPQILGDAMAGNTLRCMVLRKKYLSPDFETPDNYLRNLWLDLRGKLISRDRRLQKQFNLII